MQRSLKYESHSIGPFRIRWKVETEVKAKKRPPNRDPLTREGSRGVEYDNQMYDGFRRSI